MSSDFTRRELLTGIGVGGSVAVSGCLSMNRVTSVLSDDVVVESIDMGYGAFENVELNNVFVRENLLDGKFYHVELVVETCSCHNVDVVRVDSDSEIDHGLREMEMITDSVLIESVSEKEFQDEIRVEALSGGSVIDRVVVSLSLSSD